MSTNKREKNSDRERCKFKDAPLGKMIAVEYDPEYKHKHYCIAPNHVSIVILGESGSGKSSLLCSLVCYLELSQIIILTKIDLGVNKSYQAIQKYCNSEGIEFGIAYDPITGAALINDFKDRKEEGTYGLIICDDFGELRRGVSADKYTTLTSIISAQMRNYGYRNIIICQNLQSVNTTVRVNLSASIYFRTNEQRCIDLMRDDAVASGIFKRKEDFLDLYDLVRSKPFSFIWLDRVRKLVFICIGGKEIQEVEFCNDIKDTDKVAKQISEDAHFQALKKEYEDLKERASDSESGRDPLDKMRFKRMKKNIENFVTYIANKYSLELNKVRDYIHETLNVS